MTIQEEIAAEIDWRDGEMAELRVILHKAKLTSGQRETYIRYIVPAIYALWEGFVKKSIELYSNEINKSGVPLTNLHENILAHAIPTDDVLALDRERIQFNIQKKFSLYICEYIGNPFPLGLKIPTKSNVNYDVLSDILNRFNLGVVDNRKKGKLDKLLAFRNKIAHGDNSVHVIEEDINEFTRLIQDLMLDIFNKIDYAITNKTFLKPVVR